MVHNSFYIANAEENSQRLKWRPDAPGFVDKGRLLKKYFEPIVQIDLSMIRSPGHRVTFRLVPEGDIS